MKNNTKNSTLKCIFASFCYSAIISWLIVMFAHRQFIFSNYLGLFVPNFVMCFCVLKVKKLS